MSSDVSFADISEKGPVLHFEEVSEGFFVSEIDVDVFPDV